VKLNKDIHGSWNLGAPLNHLGGVTPFVYLRIIEIYNGEKYSLSNQFFFHAFVIFEIL
jgi:hypothetical protein